VSDVLYVIIEIDLIILMFIVQIVLCFFLYCSDSDQRNILVLNQLIVRFNTSRIIVNLLDAAGIGLVVKQQPHYSLVAILNGPDQAGLSRLHSNESMAGRTQIRYSESCNTAHGHQLRKSVE
jgi:hypothetical protein